jgi:hypothetical protein
VLRLRGSNRVDWKSDHLRDISTKSIVTPPDGRSPPPPVHISCCTTSIWERRRGSIVFLLKHRVINKRRIRNLERIRFEYHFIQFPLLTFQSAYSISISTTSSKKQLPKTYFGGGGGAVRKIMCSIFLSSNIIILLKEYLKHFWLNHINIICVHNLFVLLETIWLEEFSIFSCFKL